MNPCALLLALHCPLILALPSAAATHTLHAPSVLQLSFASFITLLKMLDIDKPLDELIKQSRQQKREQAKERRQKEREAREAKKDKNAKKDDGSKMDLDAPAKETPKARGGIRKKRRSRGGDKSKTVDGEVVRKNERKENANGSSDGKQGNGSTSRKPNKGAKVSVFNLDHGVTQSDISELFETVGPLRSARLIILQDGRSSGSAEVVFENMSHALEAIRRYNNVPLDNRPLKITLSTESAPIRVSRGRRGGRKLVVDGDGPSFSRRNSDGAGFGRRGGGGNNSGDESPRGNFRNRGDSDASPANKNSNRFNDDDDNGRFNDNDRFGDNDRSYSRRNNRRSRRSYDRRGGSSPNGNQNYMD